MQDSIAAFAFGGADLAAAPSGAKLPPIGLADTVDVAGLIVPFTGTVIAMSVEGAPAGSDTVSVTPLIGANARGAGASTIGSLAGVQIASGGAQALSPLNSKDQADAQIAAGQFLFVNYTTTTGGTYTPKDVYVVLYVATGREDV
jgi:hypothetical protein